MEKNTLQNSLNEFPKGTTDNIDSIMIKDAAGNQYWIAKADLASVLGGLIPYFQTGGRIYPDNSDLNSITSYGIYSGASLRAMTNCPSDAPSLLFILIVYGYDGYKRLVQTAISANGYIRSRAYTNTTDGETWTEWG